MATAIKVPDLGTTVDEIKIVAWLVEEGQSVKRGDVLAEIETDKATIELESVAEGVLLKLITPAGETAQEGDVLAYIGEMGESVPDEEINAANRGTAAEPVASERLPVQRPAVSRMVSNLAKKVGVDLATVQGTGQGGVITRQDVLQARKAGPKRETDPDRERLPRSQAAVAKAVLKSCSEIPHLHVTAAIDMTVAERVRNQSAVGGAKIGYDAIFLKAMAGAIQATPLIAARLDGEFVIRPEGVHIAVAIGFENDLVLPVVRNVDQKDLPTLQSEIDDLIAQARAHTFKAEQMTGGCITLTNLGMYPIESFDPIIFPEHSAILAVGAVQKKPVVLDDRVAIRPMATIKLAVDHRLINGRTAAEFICNVKEIIETVMSYE